MRKADADWAVAANSASVDAWLAFYADDAVVRLPNDNLASGKELLRQAVTRLLGLPHVSVAWRPIKVEVAPSGDQALLLDSFELRFSWPERGARIRSRPTTRDLEKAARRRLEMHRGCLELGRGRCGGSGRAAPVAPPQLPRQRTFGASAAARLRRSAISAVPGGNSGNRTAETGTGHEIRRDACVLRGHDQQVLSEAPEVSGFHSIPGDHQAEQGYTTGITGALLMRETRTYGWTVKATINAKNSPDTTWDSRPTSSCFAARRSSMRACPYPGARSLSRRRIKRVYWRAIATLKRSSGEIR